MAQCLRGECLRDMTCTVHDLEVMSSNPSRANLDVLGTSVWVILEPETIILSCS